MIETKRIGNKAVYTVLFLLALILSIGVFGVSKAYAYELGDWTELLQTHGHWGVCDDAGQPVDYFNVSGDGKDTDFGYTRNVVCPVCEKEFGYIEYYDNDPEKLSSYPPQLGVTGVLYINKESFLMGWNDDTHSPTFYRDVENEGGYWDLEQLDNDPEYLESLIVGYDAYPNSWGGIQEKYEATYRPYICYDKYGEPIINWRNVIDENGGTLKFNLDFNTFVAAPVDAPIMDTLGKEFTPEVSPNGDAYFTIDLKDFEIDGYELLTDETYFKTMFTWSDNHGSRGQSHIVEGEIRYIGNNEYRVTLYSHLQNKYKHDILNESFKYDIQNGTNPTIDLGLVFNYLPINKGDFSGTWGSCDWHIDEDGVLIITGSDRELSYFSPEDNTYPPYPDWIVYQQIIKGVRTEASSYGDAVFPADCSDAFSMLTNATFVDFSTNVDTSQVCSMFEMFAGCECLETLDISGFDTSSATNMESMFSECPSLATINVSDSWNTDKVVNSEYMFLGCESLVGENNTVFDESFTDATYARVDTAETPGYFTYRSYAPSPIPDEPSENQTSIAFTLAFKATGIQSTGFSNYKEAFAALNN